jgi:hypothetical protein
VMLHEPPKRTEKSKSPRKLNKKITKPAGNFDFMQKIGNRRRRSPLAAYQI